MSAIGKLKRYCMDADYRFAINDSLGMYKNMADRPYLERKFKARLGYPLNLDAPKTFNEKLQWLKLYDRNPEYTKLVDKYEVKSIVAKKIGQEYIIPTLGVWDRPEDIDFDSLPEQFVLKCTHDSGGLVICKDKSSLDRNAAVEKLRNALKRDYYRVHREWPYKDVPLRVIAEKYLSDSRGEMMDYKIMCFNGTARCSFVCSQRYGEKGLHVTFFDLNWNVMPFERHYPHVKEGLPKPRQYEKMLELAQTLSEDIPFVRVDFYEVDGKIYFGEMTFYPGSGFEEFTPDSWDETLGSWIKLPEKRRMEQ